VRRTPENRAGERERRGECLVRRCQVRSAERRAVELQVSSEERHRVADTVDLAGIPTLEIASNDAAAEANRHRSIARAR